MASIRIKVQLSDNKSSNNSNRKTPVAPLRFIYVLQSPSNKTIDELIHLLEKYIIRQYSHMNIQIVRLMTDDGYFLSNDDFCSDVFKDNDRIICFDMENFVQENYSTLDLQNLWCEIKQHDASDDYEKYIQIGLNNLGKLFIRMHGAYNSYGLYLFNIFQLIKIVAEKPESNTKYYFSKKKVFFFFFCLDNLIARLESKNWFIEAKWEYDSSSNTILFLIYSLKIGSNEQIWSNKLQLLLDESRMCIEKGEITSLSGEINDGDILTEKQRERLQELASKIPLAKRTGPEIDTEKDANKKLTKHECEGESLIQMAYGSTNTVTAYQESYSSEKGTFRQYFVITHINFCKKSNENIPEGSQEKSSTATSVTNVKVFYQTNDESWCECDDVAIAPIALRNEEPSGWLADSIINFESDKLISYAIKGWLSVKGQSGKDNLRRRRIHKNLPQPFKLKIIIQDNFNKQSSLIVEQLNKPLDFDTITSYTKYNQSSIKDLLGFVYADDCGLDERHFMAIYLNNDDHIVVYSNRGSSISLERKYIRTMEYNSKQNNTTEVAFDSIYYQYDTLEEKAIGLFDPETFIFYAIRVEISTKTSKTEETILLPVERIK